MQTRHLTPEQLAQWKADGFLIMRAHELFSDQEVASLLNWTKEVQEWPETAGKWMKYFEKSLKDGTRILNRVEKFLDFHEGLRRVFYEGKIPGIVSELCEEPVVLYKEKINFKLPGGEGFKPHQDHAAGWWRYGHQYHISMLVTIDAADLENGCLELVRGEHTKGLFGKEYEEIPEEYVKKFKWEAAEMKPGDVAFFDSYVPHRSGPNMTDRPRRSMYITYGKAKDGDWRDKYYEDKRKSFPPDIERESGKEYKYKI